MEFEKQYILEPTLRRLHELKLGKEVLSEAVSLESLCDQLKLNMILSDSKLTFEYHASITRPSSLQYP